MKPFPLTNGHGRYIMAVTPERILLSVGEWPLPGACKRCNHGHKFVTVSHLKRLRDGRFTSAPGSRSGLKNTLETTGVVIETCVK
jgi:hypothetical protein